MKCISIVAGGRLDKQFLSDIKKPDVIIGVDRGALWLLKQGIVPDVAIGDFDSVTTQEFKIIEKNIQKVIRHPIEKNATDLELAVEEAIKLDSTEVIIFGGLGSRFDHSFAAMQMLLKLESHNICGYLVDKTNKITIVRREYAVIKSTDFPYISIFPHSESAIVTLKGFKYDVNHQVFHQKSTLGVSNEITAKIGKILVHDGLALVIQSRD